MSTGRGAHGVWILSGPSGAGKATALRYLERQGVECVDNLPVDLVEGFSALPRDRVAVAVIDGRQGDNLERFEGVPGARVLFLDARDDVLVRRIAESTRPHPMEGLGRGPAAVSAERAVLQTLRAAADTVVDTSDLTVAQLEQRLHELMLAAMPRAGRVLALLVSSFGYKFGPELEADWVVDSRLMQNPFWDADLRPLTGLDDAVRDFVLEQAEAKRLLSFLRDLLRWSVPHYLDHGRAFLHVAIGCTGGRHRSVVIAEELAARLRDDEMTVRVRHRDVERSDPRVP